MAPVCLAGLALATLAACSSPTVSPAAGNTVGPVGPKVQRVVLAAALHRLLRWVRVPAGKRET